VWTCPHKCEISPGGAAIVPRIMLRYKNLTTGK
jgi:hypothetical protein